MARDRWVTRHRAAAASAAAAGVLVAGGTALGLGLAFGWPGFQVLGLALLAVLAVAAAAVLPAARLSVERAIAPARVPKGSPAIAALSFANRGRRAVGPTVAVQPFGDTVVRTVIPRLRGGERGLRTYRLPTRQRGVFDVGPVEITRRDPFGLFRATRRYGAVERVWVHPHLYDLRPLPAGRTRTLDGPTSDSAPQGTVTFHRLRDYTPGDDLRLVHWRSSARVGRLVVKHNVDTSQPYTVVVLDQRSGGYTAEGFEAAVDVAASVAVVQAANKAPVELRLSDGSVVGGPRWRDVTPLIDQLTAVVADLDADLAATLLALRRGRGGTSLVVVTGGLDPDAMVHVAPLRRRFDRVVVVSIDADPPAAPTVPGVRVIVAADAAGAATAWNAATLAVTA